MFLFFFSHVLDSLSVDARGIIQYHPLIDKLSIDYKIIYGLFNFEKRVTVNCTTYAVLM